MSERDAEPSTTQHTVRVLAHQGGIVLVAKPAAWPTEPTPDSSTSLVQALSRHLAGAKVHAASRLDVGVSGVVLCTVDHDAAARVEELRRAGALRRTYLAIASGPLPQRGAWTWPLGRRRDHAGRVLSSPRAKDLRPARTSYELLCAPARHADGEYCLLRVRPATGRTHQIRAHAAEAKAPLLGDRRYGGPCRMVSSSGRVEAIERIMLHALRIEVDDIVSALDPAPPPLRDAWRALGGDPPAWETL